MKNYTLPQSILLLFLILFLFNCGGSTNKTTSTSRPNVDAATKKIIDQVTNPELKKGIETFVKDKNRIMEYDFLLLILDETSSQEVQEDILNYFRNKAGKNIPPKAIYAVLFKAIQQKKEQLVNNLLKSFEKIDETIRNNEDRTLLHEAVVNSSPSIANLLTIKGGAKLVNAGSTMHGTPLHYVLAAPFKLGNKETNTPIIRAEIFKDLLKTKGININAKNPTGKTASKLAQELATLNAGNPDRKAFYDTAVTKLQEMK